MCACARVGGGPYFLSYNYRLSFPTSRISGQCNKMKLKNEGRNSSPNTRHYPSIFSVGGKKIQSNLRPGLRSELKHTEQTAGLLPLNWYLVDRNSIQHFKHDTVWCNVNTLSNTTESSPHKVLVLRPVVFNLGCETWQIFLNFTVNLK